jgi:predicted hotdog family 3-hydroxylacyl-ACP dehydratase
MNRDRAWIAARIPHAGAMCLLDRIVDGDSSHIICAATSHRDPHHPLRTHGRLASVHAIEYAAQAMALHRAFDADADGPPPAGMLASVRDVCCQVERLDDVADDLTIEATRMSGDRDLAVYGFRVSAAGRLLVSGRVTAVLDAAPGRGFR